MDSELLKARIFDTASLCEKNFCTRFLGFLSEEEISFAKSVLKNCKVNYSFYGGYENAARCYLACFCDFVDERDFPIVQVNFTFRKSEKLSHRDVLGALMGLGLKRETVGDILIEEGRAVCFVASDIADYIVSQVEKIGRTGVKAQIGFTDIIPDASRLEDFSQTVASARIDAVVAALANTSRNGAAEKIAAGFVSINSCEVLKPTKTVAAGDVVTIRKKGKFFIDSISDVTKKNRIVLKYKKYV